MLPAGNRGSRGCSAMILGIGPAQRSNLEQEGVAGRCFGCGPWWPTAKKPRRGPRWQRLSRSPECPRFAAVRRGSPHASGPGFRRGRRSALEAPSGAPARNPPLALTRPPERSPVGAFRTRDTQDKRRSRCQRETLSRNNSSTGRSSDTSQVSRPRTAIGSRWPGPERSMFQ